MAQRQLKVVKKTTVHAPAAATTPQNEALRFTALKTLIWE
jgi:hypothetical protein